MATRVKRSNSIKSSPFQKVAWNGTAENYDILANGPGGSVGGLDGKCCQALIVASPAGALVYVDAAGNTVTVPQAILLAQPLLPVQAKSLVASGSGNAYVLVLWDDE
jgi:hypothetical protein